MLRRTRKRCTDANTGAPGAAAGAKSKGAENMKYMFYRAQVFNSDISTWNVSRVASMLSMFSDVTAFDSDISKWDVSRVTDMKYMFPGATAFNSDISKWDDANAQNMMC